MRALIVGGQAVPESVYWKHDGYNHELLKEWHAKKRRIRCACQKHDPKPELHVRRTKSGFTIANNPEQSDKHIRICPFYGEVTRSEPKGEGDPAVVRDGDRLIVHVNLFSHRSSDLEGQMGIASGEEDAAVKPHFNAPDEEPVERAFRKRSFSDFIHDWYQFAMEWIDEEKAEPSQSTVLYYMWVCLIKHRIMVGTEDFYYKAYVPNAKFMPDKGQKIVIGYIRNVERVVGGERWTVQGLRKHSMTVLIREAHVPRYFVLGKLAALRVDFEADEPTVFAPAKAWRITKQGWWMHSEAEWKLLRSLESLGVAVHRPRPDEVWNGYQPDFLLQGMEPPVFIDVLDPPDEKMQDERVRLRQEEEFRATRQSGVIQYVPWRAGDALPFANRNDE